MGKIQVLQPEDNNRADYCQSSHYGKNCTEALSKLVENHKNNATFILVSIQNLATIIETYDINFVQQVLTQTETELHDFAARHNATLFRLQRDHFGLVIDDCPKTVRTSLIEKLRQEIIHYGQPNDETKPVQIIACLASSQVGKYAAEEIINHAYTALYAGDNDIIYQHYEDLKDRKALLGREMELAVNIRQALRDGNLRLSYQPIIASSDGSISHYECLLRMVDGNGSLCSAGALIPIAERIGLIDQIDLQVMEMTCKELINNDEVMLAFNVSGLTTRNTLWLDRFRAIIHKNPEIAPRIIVEVTETAAQKNLAETAYFIACIQALGCQVALDDFGSGYTSFRQLKALSVDMVKIDGLFIRDLADSPDNRFFVKTLIEFTRGFGLTAVAEWVETGEIAKILMNLGVDYMQGYYFAEVENHRSWLKEGEYEAE